MPRVSKSRLHKEKLQEIEEYFSYLISSLSNSNEIQSFMEEFFTKEEKVMLAKRLVLYMMVKRGYAPQIIQFALHISYETVRIYSSLILNKSESFQRNLEKLIKRKKAKEFWAKVDKILKPIDLALNAKSNMQARAKLLSRDWT